MAPQEIFFNESFGSCTTTHEVAAHAMDRWMHAWHGLPVVAAVLLPWSGLKAHFGHDAFIQQRSSASC